MSKKFGLMGRIQAATEEARVAGESIDFDSRSPKSAPGKMVHAHQELAKANQELEVLRNKKVEIALLHEVPGRKRALTAEAFEQLKGNLSKNQLANPIVVRPRDEGGYEIVSGHNRVEAYRQLGRKFIEADIRDFEEDTVFESAFYSNLINSQLSDFEKFLGFKQIKAKTSETHEQMADRAGVDRTQITKLFKFESMPDYTIKLLEKNPSVLGYNTLEKLVKEPESSINQVVEGLVNGTFKTEKEALLSLITPKKKVLVKSEEIKSGKRIFAKVSRKEHIISVDFKDTSKLDEFESELKDLLRKYAM